MKLITSLQEKIPQKYQLGILLASIVLLGIYAYGDLSKIIFNRMNGTRSDGRYRITTTFGLFSKRIGLIIYLE